MTQLLEPHGSKKISSFDIITSFLDSGEESAKLVTDLVDRPQLSVYQSLRHFVIAHNYPVKVSIHQGNIVLCRIPPSEISS